MKGQQKNCRKHRYEEAGKIIPDDSLKFILLFFLFKRHFQRRAGMAEACPAFLVLL